MLKEFLNSLEDSQNPLLGPNIRGLQFTGMLQKEKRLRNFVHNFIHLFATVFVLSQFVELWIIRSNLANALRNLSVSMLSTVCVVKAWTFISWKKSWKDIIQSISEKEVTQMQKKDSTTNGIIAKYISYTRVVTYFYWALVTTTVFTVILAPLISVISSSELREAINNGSSPYPEIISSWVPFDKTRSYGYWAYALEHTMICFYGGGIVAAYDSNAVGIMSFFAGQLNLLKADCRRLFGEDGKFLSDREALANIQECHYQHLFLIKYSRMFNSVLSPVLFLYVIICSLMICCSAIQLTDVGYVFSVAIWNEVVLPSVANFIKWRFSQENTTTMQQIWIAEYLMALIAQLFLYCWHGNEVLHMSSEVHKGVYASAWWTRDVRMRRSVLLLGGQLRRSIVFNAGPFTTLTVATFLGILKGSYSYFTILSQNN